MGSFKDTSRVALSAKTSSTGGDGGADLEPKKRGPSSRLTGEPLTSHHHIRGAAAADTIHEAASLFPPLAVRRMRACCAMRLHTYIMYSRPSQLLQLSY